MCIWALLKLELLSIIQGKNMQDPSQLVRCRCDKPHFLQSKVVNYSRQVQALLLESSVLCAFLH